MAQGGRISHLEFEDKVPVRPCGLPLYGVFVCVYCVSRGTVPLIACMNFYDPVRALPSLSNVTTLSDRELIEVFIELS